MGFGMASNIRKKMPSSSILYILDVNRPACERFVSEMSQFGPIEIVETAKEAASNAKVFISSLPSIAAVQTVYLDETNGVAAAPTDPERLCLETSTASSSSARDISEKLAQLKGGIYIDTPISVR